LTTTGIVLIEEHAQRVKPPRMLAVPFNFGKALGKSGDPEFQQTVLNATFDLLNRQAGPILEQFESDIGPDAPIVQGTDVINSTELTVEGLVEEINALKTYYRDWLKENTDRTAFGLSGITWENLNEISGFLHRYVNGDQTDIDVRPSGCSLANFIRYCVDDLKSFYYESMMVQRPNDKDHEIHEWFWSKTAAAVLVNQLAERMKEDDDEEMRSLSFGIAR